MQGPNLAHLESGPHFMTAVRVHVDHTGCNYDHCQNPKGSTGVYAWAYSSGHCRISHQVPLWRIDYCSLAPNWVTGFKLDDDFKHLTNVCVRFSHIIDRDECAQRFGALPLDRRESCALWSLSCPTFNTLQWSTVCMPVSKAVRTLPSLSVYFSYVPRPKLTALQYPSGHQQTLYMATTKHLMMIKLIVSK